MLVKTAGYNETILSGGVGGKELAHPDNFTFALTALLLLIASGLGNWG